MGPRTKRDLIGRRFGRLVALSAFSVEGRNGRRYGKYRCQCDCGNTCEVLRSSLIQETTSSCGCFGIEARKKNAIKHGMCETRTWRSWHTAKMRCTCKSYRFYHRYGGRGIGMCKEWAESFPAFLRDMGERPEGMTLERIENDRGYEPGNCKWATGYEQHNNKSSNHWVTINGESKTVAQWARELNLSRFKVLKLANSKLS